jgi:hypothetical protein
MNEKALAKREEIGKQIDVILSDCVPVTQSQAVTTFSESIKLAAGVNQLREMFLKSPDIKDTVLAMKDTPLGFMTDRSETAIADAKRRNKTIVPYSYGEVAECCIEAMLNGYRINNNEFNIISGRFYPAKNGKYRKIVEHPEVTDFQFTTTTPLYETENRAQNQNGAITYAKVQCFASWRQKGKLVVLGKSDPDTGLEDKLVFKIRVNAYMGDDAIVGKALSKLFSRVLMRIEGKILPESTDIQDAEILPAALDADTEETSRLPGDGVAVDPEVVKAFDHAFKKELKDPKFNEFMEKSAAANDLTLEEFKSEAMANVEPFKEAFETWKELNAGK